MSKPAPKKKGWGQQNKAAAAAAVVPVGVRAQLDCQSCFEPFAPVVGPRYPRILSPCAHTFCTECITNQLKARGPDNFRCLTHEQPIAIVKAEDVKANFALIELLELIEKDADHQVVDERTKPPSCSECDEAATCYCKNDDACYCDAHRASEHSGKARSSHVIVPVAERSIAVPKCGTHKSKELDMWCAVCSALCCTMCERSGAHKEHADKLAPVDDVVISQRDKIEKMSQEAKSLTSGKLDKEAASLIQLRADFEASARRVQEDLTKKEAEIMRAVEARFTALRKDAQAQLAKGLKHISMRVDDLTVTRSRAALVPEEAARVLRMSDYAMLAHALSVEQNAVRARKGWEEYQRESLLPQMMELRSEPKLLLSEIAVAGLIHQPWTEFHEGKLVPAAAAILPLSSHRSSDRETVVKSLKGALQSCTCQYCRVSCVNAPATCSYNQGYYGHAHVQPHAWTAIQPQPLIQLVESLEKKQ